MDTLTIGLDVIISLGMLGLIYALLCDILATEESGESTLSTFAIESAQLRAADVQPLLSGRPRNAA